MKQLQVVNGSGSAGAIQPVLQFDNKKLEVIRRTVAKNATDDEFEMFMHLAKTYELDPFIKEIFFIKYVKKGQDPSEVEPTIMTSRDGYLKIADRNPMFDGLVSDVVRKNDTFKRTTSGVEHTYSGNRGDIIGVYALVYRKDRQYPVYVFAPITEYRKQSKIWNEYPSAMILKVAEAMALKRAFSISGLVSKEEMDYDDKSVNEVVVVNPDEKQSKPAEPVEKPQTEAPTDVQVEMMIDNATMETLSILLHDPDANAQQLRSDYTKKFLQQCEVERVRNLTKEQGRELVKRLQRGNEIQSLCVNQDTTDIYQEFLRFENQEAEVIQTVYDLTDEKYQELVSLLTNLAA